MNSDLMNIIPNLIRDETNLLYKHLNALTLKIKSTRIVC